jgi:xanthine dehydrogenase accessory factor
MASVLFERVLVLIRGGGDLASGVAYRLTKAGFPAVMTELAQPLAIRRTVAFASAVFEGQVTIDTLTARRVDRVADVQLVLARGEIPVLVDEAGTSLSELKPAVVVDARLAKRNLGTTIHDAALVIALGPGFEAGKDCHAVIETNRGHYLGRVIWQGAAEPNTGQPGSVKGRVGDRVLRAPADGHVVPNRQIGDMLQEGELIGSVDGMPVIAPFDGMLRGLVHPTVQVFKGMKIGDVDPRGERDFCFKISEKSLAIGGGVLEAILSAPQITGMLKRGLE